MKQGEGLLLQLQLSSFLFPPRKLHHPLPCRLPLIFASTPDSSTLLTARERRQLRNQNRAAVSGHNWREELEKRLIKKPKKRQPSSWTEDLNLDNLSFLGPQWYILKVSRLKGHLIPDSLARSLSNNFPDLQFKIYAPSVKERRKLNKGSYSIKERPLFPGCVFLNVVLNRELHDFIRECDGVGGFVGSKVGSTKRQINRPRPVSKDDIEGIFLRAKQEQEKADEAAPEEDKEALDQDLLTDAGIESYKSSQKSSNRGTVKLPAPGSTVRVISGTFSGFDGNVKKVNRKNKKAVVGLTLFGKESVVELDLKEIAREAASFTYSE